ncbi:MAG: helix-turn-helix domain-containing protein [Chitinivibrionales bacterium]|nr:helix-turn-helix domain-containing protein [Chitinivibrionales bacterium]
MTDKNNKYWKALSDNAILRELGAFIRHHRLGQNKTQSQLAARAGINRTTLVEFEQGKRSNTLTLIQLLRALDQLQVLESFHIQPRPSPIQLAQLEQKKRRRARAARQAAPKPKSDW